MEMTRLPMEFWGIKPRPDLPAYELNAVDARPGSGATATDDHHIWRRSFGKDFRESWWVELATGEVVPNRVGLSQESHALVTSGAHMIVAAHTGERTVFYWMSPEAIKKAKERGETPYGAAVRFGAPLYPQPGPPAEEAVVVEHEHRAGEVPAGSTCPTCERRVPRPKKSDSPATKTTSYRIPVDSVEAHDEVLAAVSEHMGIGTKKAHWKFQTVISMAAVVLQLPKRDVQAG
jgi:hypothetical protein